MIASLKCWWRGYHTMIRYDMFGPIRASIPPTVCVCVDCCHVERIFAG